MTASERDSVPSQPHAVHEVLGKLQLFEGLSDESLDRMASIASEESHGRDSVIFREGDVGDKLYLILEGKVRISRNVGGMGEEALAILGPGEAFGEMALIEDAPRSADVHAHVPCRLLVITREAFEDLLFIHKDVAYEILWNFIKILSRRLREANDKMALLSSSGRF